MFSSKLLFLCIVVLCVGHCFAFQGFQVPTGALSNATNILQQLLDQANNLESNGGGTGGGLGNLGGLGGTGGTNPVTSNPIVEFFRTFLMFFINMFNSLIRMFTGGLVNGVAGPMKSADIDLKLKADQSENEINDDDLKTLHAKAHGPECACSQFNRVNFPQFAPKDEGEKKISKRSTDSVVTADQVIEYFDSKTIQKLLDQFLRSDRQ